MTITVTPNLGLTRGWSQGDGGWGAAMNANLDRLDAVSAVTCLPGEDLQAAIDATPAGGALQLAAGSYVAPTAAGWLVTRPITIRGAGVGGADADVWGTTLRPYLGDTGTPGANNKCLTFTNTGGVYLKDLCIANMSPPSTLGSGHGIYVTNATNSVAVSDVYISRVQVHNMGGFGILIDGGDGTPDTSVNALRFDTVDVASCRASGVKAIYCTAPTFVNLYSHSNYLIGLHLSVCGLPRIIASYFEANGTSATDDTQEPQVRLDTSNGGEIVGCGFEGFQGGTNKIGLLLNNCYATSVSGCNFQNGTSVAGTVGIRMSAGSGDLCGGIKIGPNIYSRVQLAVLGDTSKVEGIFVEQQTIAVRDGTCPGEISIPYASDTFNMVIPRTSAHGHRIYGLRFPPLANVTTQDLTDVVSNSSCFLGFDVSRNTFVFYNGTAWYKLTATTLT